VAPRLALTLGIICGCDELESQTRRRATLFVGCLVCVIRAFIAYGWRCYEEPDQLETEDSKQHRRGNPDERDPNDRKVIPARLSCAWQSDIENTASLLTEAPRFGDVMTNAAIDTDPREREQNDARQGQCATNGQLPSARG
jgi:hypothetical protein